MKIDKLIVDSICSIPFKAYALRIVSREGLSISTALKRKKEAEEIRACRTTCEAEQRIQKQIRIDEMWERTLNG
jgi:hypothetical protein